MRLKDKLKQVFNLTTILRCYIDAVGYGLGYFIPTRLNYSLIVCIIICFVTGLIFDYFANKLLNSTLFVSSKRNKIILAIVIYVIYFIICYTIDCKYNYDIDDQLFFTVGSLIIFQLICFVYEYIKNKNSKNNQKSSFSFNEKS